MSLSYLMEHYGSPIISSTIGGMIRKMFYNADTKDVRIYVQNRNGSVFVLNPPVFLAIEAWKDPYFYADAAMRGIDNPNRLNPSNLEMVA